MIPDEQQDLAALHAFGMLDDQEAADFERSMAADVELRTFTQGLRDAAASVARQAPRAQPPAALRRRVLRAAAMERRSTEDAGWSWVPWAAAAALAVTCALLALREGTLRREMAGLRGLAQMTAPAATLERISFCELELTAQGQPAPRATVAWDESRRQGIVRVNRLEAPAPGKDYQLWVVEDGVKEPVSAGVLQIGENGSGESLFKPLNAEARPAKAFAISVEKAGGAERNEGPIILLGKL